MRWSVVPSPERVSAERDLTSSSLYKGIGIGLGGSQLKPALHIVIVVFMHRNHHT